MVPFFPSFFERRKFARDTGNAFSQALPSDLAEITEVFAQKPYRVNIRLFSNGKILEDVRFAGPFYTKDGKLHGVKLPYAKNQLALIQYLHGRAEAPVITQCFPFGSGDINQNNLGSASHAYDTETVELGHRSGHRFVLDSNKQVIYDNKNQAVFEIDFASKEVRLGEGWKLKIGNEVVADENGIELQKGDFVTNKEGTPLGLTTHIHQGVSGPTSVGM